MASRRYITYSLALLAIAICVIGISLFMSYKPSTTSVVHNTRSNQIILPTDIENMTRAQRLTFMNKVLEYMNKNSSGSSTTNSVESAKQLEKTLNSMPKDNTKISMEDKQAEVQKIINQMNK